MKTAKKHYTILFFSSELGEKNAVFAGLEQSGYDILPAKTLDEAQSLLGEFRPDLIMIDAAHSGLGFIKQWKPMQKSLGDWQKTLVVFFLVTENQKQQIINDVEPEVVEPLQRYPFHALPNTTLTANHENITELLWRLRAMFKHYEQSLNLQEEFALLQRAYRSIRREMMEIWNIQRLFLKREFPKHPDFSVTANYQPSTQVGGDYYDVLQLDEEHWGIVMADIAGHGASAALVMALTQMTVKEFAPGIRQPGKALDVFNQKLNEHLNSQHFVTMFYAVLNLRTLELTFTSAGHCPPLYYSKKSGACAFLKSVPAFPLRTFENHTYDEQTAVLAPGDRILLYTDGVADLLNPDDDLYGVERLKKVFVNKQSLELEDLVLAIINDTERFREGRERLDDFTLMLFELTEKSASAE